MTKNDDRESYIEDLYNSSMWVTDKHRQLLYKL